MTGAAGCGGIRHLLGVYLLGAIEPPDRAAVDSHLVRCPGCTEELAGLAALPALLGRVSAAEAGGLSADEAEWDSQVDPPPGTGLPRLLDRTATIRRVRKWRGMAAAVVVIAVAVAALRALTPAASPASGQGAWRTLSARDAVTLASATVDYAPEAWGTELEVRVGRIAAGTTCQLRVTSSHGQQAVAGGWTVAAGHAAAWYPASASFPASSVRSYSVTADGKTLVTIPAGPLAARAPLPPSGPGWPVTAQPAARAGSRRLGDQRTPA